MSRLNAWWSSSKILGVAACAAGAGLAIAPTSYNNPAYRVLFSTIRIGDLAFRVTPREAGILWLTIGILSIVAASAWTIALLGSALIGWGLGLGAAALTKPPSGAPLGWIWFVGFGVAVLRTLAVGGPNRMRS